MKYTLSVLFCFIGLASFAQDIDENGRTKGSTPSISVSSIENDVFLKKDKVKSTSSNIVVEYSLPFGKSSGKLVIFHPKRDEELKTITLKSNNGSVSINTEELGHAGFNVGMYLNDDTFIQSQLIY